MATLGKAGVILNVIDQSIMGVTSFKKNIMSINSTVSKSLTSMKNYGDTLGKLFLPSAIAGGFVIKAFADIEDSLRKLQSVSTTVSGDLQQDMLRTKDEAKRLSQVYRFSTNDMIKASYNLASSGLNVEQTIGLMEGSAKLAAAGIGDLSQTTYLLGAIMNQFRTELDRGFNTPLEKGQLIADTFAYTVKKSQVTLPDLAEGMKYAGSVASGLNIPLSETLAYLGTFNTFGLKGTVAGTSFSNMMLSMTKAAKDLGVSVKDTNGILRSPIAIMKDVRDALDWVRDSTGQLVLTQESSNKVFEIFNRRGGRGAIIAIQNADAIQKYANEIDTATKYSDYMANTIESSLSSVLKRTFNNFVNLSEEIGNSLKPKIIEISESLNEFTRSIRDTDGEMIKNIAILIKWGLILGTVGKGISIIAGAGKVLLPIITGLGAVLATTFTTLATGVVGIYAVVKAMVVLTVSTGITAGAVLGLVYTIPLAIAGLVLLYNAFKETGTVSEFFGDVIDSVTRTFVNNKRQIKISAEVWEKANNQIKNSIESIEKAQDKLGGNNKFLDIDIETGSKELQIFRQEIDRNNNIIQKLQEVIENLSGASKYLFNTFGLHTPWAEVFWQTSKDIETLTNRNTFLAKAFSKVRGEIISLGSEAEKALKADGLLGEGNILQLERADELFNSMYETAKKLSNIGRTKQFEMLDIANQTGNFKDSEKIIEKLFKSTKDLVKIDPIQAYKQFDELKKEITTTGKLSGKDWFSDYYMREIEKEQKKATEQVLRPTGKLGEVAKYEELNQKMMRKDLIDDYNIDVNKLSDKFDPYIKQQKYMNTPKLITENVGGKTVIRTENDVDREKRIRENRYTEPDIRPDKQQVEIDSNFIFKFLLNEQNYEQIFTEVKNRLKTWTKFNTNYSILKEENPM